MKKRILADIVILSILFFVSCKKEDLSRPVVTSSQWQYSGITYNGDSTYFSGESLLSIDKALNEIKIIFLERPVVSGTYDVSSSAVGPFSYTDCVIKGDYMLGLHSFASTGVESNKVIVTVSDAGKITASFINVAVKDGASVKYVTGTLIEK
jgi:hypothetical protein